VTEQEKALGAQNLARMTRDRLGGKKIQEEGREDVQEKKRNMDNGAKKKGKEDYVENSSRTTRKGVGDQIKNETRKVESSRTRSIMEVDRRKPLTRTDRRRTESRQKTSMKLL